MKILFLLLLFLPLLLVNAQIFNVLDFGAVGDGTTDDTIPINNTINECNQQGGGVILFPKGKYLTSPFNLSSNMILRVTEEATILGSQNISSWPVIPFLPSYGSGREMPGPRYTSLVHGQNVTNVTIEGGGTIDGQGDIWWKMHEAKELNYSRGSLVEFIYCEDLKIFNVTLQNSPFWTVHPTYCNNVLVQGISIHNPRDSPNTDGIDPDSSWNVLIEDTTISVGDDMIAVKSGLNQFGIDFGRPSANITVRNCRFLAGEGISIGSETSGGIKNISFYNIHVTSCDKGPYIKTNQERGAYIEDIYYSNITLDGVPTAIELTMLYGEHLTTDWNEGYSYPPPVVQNVEWEGITGTGIASAGSFLCLEESPCTLLNLSNVDIKSAIDDHFLCSFAHGVSNDVSPKACFDS